MKLPTIRSDEAVTFKDIESEIEFARQGLESISEFYYRLSAQKAPLELVAEMSVVAQLYQQIHERLAAITNCFPR